MDFKAWAMRQWFPENSVNVPIRTLKRITSIIHLLAYLIAPFYQLHRLLLVKHKRVGMDRSTMRGNLELKAAKYLNWMRVCQDEHGFIHSDEGDALLFTGLVGAAGASVDITAARRKGQWFRRPIDHPYEGASSISRDMLIGLLWYCWRKKRLDILENLWKFGTINSWVMGTGDASRTPFLPALQGTLAMMIAKLGGKKHLARFHPQVWADGVVGFEAHLQVLHILLQGEISGELDANQLICLRRHAERQPWNPLFTAGLARYTDGDFTSAEESLANQHWWPDHRLPNNLNRYEAWLPQRDYGEDWEPDHSHPRNHTGGDLLFVLSI